MLWIGLEEGVREERTLEVQISFLAFPPNYALVNDSL